MCEAEALTGAMEAADSAGPHVAATAMEVAATEMQTAATEEAETVPWVE